jgi:hypothetical protein
MLVLTSYVVRDFAVFRLVDRQSINEQDQPVCAEGCFIQSTLFFWLVYAYVI